jgi:hypothetical protein
MHVVRFGGDNDYFSPARRETQNASRPLVLAVGRDGGRDYATFMAAVDGLDVDALAVAPTLRMCRRMSRFAWA